MEVIGERWNLDVCHKLATNRGMSQSLLWNDGEYVMRPTATHCTCMWMHLAKTFYMCLVGRMQWIGRWTTYRVNHLSRAICCLGGFFLAQVVHQGMHLYSPASRLLNVIDLLVCFWGIGGEVDEWTRKWLGPSCVVVDFMFFWLTQKPDLTQQLEAIVMPCALHDLIPIIPIPYSTTPASLEPNWTDLNYHYTYPVSS